MIRLSEINVRVPFHSNKYAKINALAVITRPRELKDLVCEISFLANKKKDYIITTCVEINGNLNSKSSKELSEDVKIICKEILEARRNGYSH